MPSLQELIARLESLGASSDVRAYAHLLNMPAPSRGMRGLPSLQVLLDWAALDATTQEVNPLPPVLRTLAALSSTAHEPSWLREPGRGDPAKSPISTLTRRELRAMTPIVRSRLPFQYALELGDDLSRWSEVGPQIKVVAPPLDLPRNGALRRVRLTKETDVSKPIASGFCSIETVDITVTGHVEAGGGRGFRRYEHTLHSSSASPAGIRLLRDDGWIELSGSQTGCQVRISKHIVVEGPAELLDGPWPGLELQALLFLWAAGFLEAATPEPSVPSAKPARPITAPNRPGRIDIRDNRAHVAVLGAGPAGLACAWLLSRSGQRYWEPPEDRPGLSLSVSLVEQEVIPGGKAASGRREDLGCRHRVEEHGLHVLMGCYSNLLALLQDLGATDNLTDMCLTRLGDGSGVDPAAALPVELTAWGAPATPPVGPGGAGWFSVGDSDTHRLRRLTLRRSVHASPMVRLLVTMGNGLLASEGSGAGPGRSVVELALRRAMARLPLFALSFDTEFWHRRDLASASQAGADKLVDQLVSMAGELRSIARIAGKTSGQSPERRLLLNSIELATTVIIGLGRARALPMWALDDPSDLLGQHDMYLAWVDQMHELDGSTLTQWLLQHGMDARDIERSPVLQSLLSALFTRSDEIAAGTFLHGMARFFFSYQGAPYRRLRGGTGEAVIAPLVGALLASGRVNTLFGRSVVQVEADRSGSHRISQVQYRQLQKATNDAPTVQKPDGLPGWSVPLKCDLPDQSSEGPLRADAYVLAIPPFDAAFRKGLPGALAQALEPIRSTATIGLQHWSTVTPHYPSAIVAGLDGPLRCAAAMEHLREGPDCCVPAVYYCGDVDDAEAEAWARDRSRADQWLKAWSPAFQGDGFSQDAPHLSVNAIGSARYVCADPTTQQARPPVDGSDYDNLWLAGDWTRSAFNCGAIEAAVTSGLEAARHILVALGCKVHWRIVGTSPPT